MAIHERRQASQTNKFLDSPFPFVEDGKNSSDSLAGIQRFILPDDLSVVFQPIVHLGTAATFAHEALVRCRVKAFRNPTDLIARSVEEGCTGRLGRMIREVAVPLCSGVPIFLNIHPIELKERWLVRPDDPLNFHDHLVYLEVTESVPITHFQLCRDVLREIRARSDVRLVVDDLGAGYSNLGRIADLEPAVVKLDRELIVGLERGSRRQKLVSGIVRLCVDLGAEVVAEGIETAEELEAIRETGVHYGQGYLFARPGFPLPQVDTSLLKPRKGSDERQGSKEAARRE